MISSALDGNLNPENVTDVVFFDSHGKRIASLPSGAAEAAFLQREVKFLSQRITRCDQEIDDIAWTEGRFRIA
jgi:hypothetical protein